MAGDFLSRNIIADQIDLDATLTIECQAGRIW
jgi:hypothetical protein